MRKSDWQRMEGRERERERDGEAQRQYYLAVDRQQFKMGTLVDLLDVIGRRSGLPIVLCCSSRDGLDDVCANLSSLPYISISCVHSDLTEAERSVCLEKFRQAALEWMLKHDVESQGNEEDLKKQSSHVLVMTDSCLPMQTIGEAPVSAQVLINYDLPAKKEAYLRRLAACMPAIHISNSNKVTGATIPTMAATSGLVINMVVGGEIVNLRNIEEGCSIIIEEMPIHLLVALSNATNLTLHKSCYILLYYSPCLSMRAGCYPCIKGLELSTGLIAKYSISTSISNKHSIQHKLFAFVTSFHASYPVLERKV